MKVAVTYENGEVFQHFGRTPQFKIYEIENGEVKSSKVIDTGETGHGALAGFFAGGRSQCNDLWRNRRRSNQCHGRIRHQGVCRGIRKRR